MKDYNSEYLKLLERAAQDVDLTGGEARTLQWLAGWEQNTVANIASVIRKSREAERSRAAGLTKKELLTVWGYLQSLKDIYENKARETATRSDATRAKLAGDWMKMAGEITALQHRINEEAELCE